MKVFETIVPAWKCLRCGHIWPKTSRVRGSPGNCTSCNSPRWHLKVVRKGTSKKMKKMARRPGWGEHNVIWGPEER